MSEANEIDELFLNPHPTPNDDTRLSHLREYINSIPRITPYLDLIHGEIDGLRRIFAVYDIQLGILSESLNQLQERNKHLEYKGQHEERLYKALRDLCVALTIDEEHTQVLESASFTDPDDMVKVEKALAILGDIDLSKYKIRVAAEKHNEIIDNERKFLKRFASFLGKLFVKSESTGELCVHRRLYETMLRYKCVFTFAKKYSDYYTVLCSAYIHHSKELYESEFEANLNSMSDLVDTRDKLKTSVLVLMKSHESLVTCEYNFLQHMEMLGAPEEIFKNVNELILEFLGNMAEKSRLTTILALREYLLAPAPSVLGESSYRKAVVGRCELFEEMLLKTESEKPLSAETVELINYLGKEGKVPELYRKLLDVFIGKLVEDLEHTNVNEAIKRYAMLCSLETENKEVFGVFNEMLPQIIIGFVFGSNDVIGRTESIIKTADVRVTGLNEALRYTKSIIVQHADDADKDRIEHLFSGRVTLEKL